MSKSKEIFNYSISLEEIADMQNKIITTNDPSWKLASYGSFTAIGAIFALAALIGEI